MFAGFVKIMPNINMIKVSLRQISWERCFLLSSVSEIPIPKIPEIFFGEINYMTLLYLSSILDDSL